jgi:hypothetical protein
MRHMLRVEIVLALLVVGVVLFVVSVGYTVYEARNDRIQLCEAQNEIRMAVRSIVELQRVSSADPTAPFWFDALKLVDPAKCEGTGIE